ncbi:hypothetical protein D3C80_2037060 [compost metagenome]
MGAQPLTNLRRCAGVVAYGNGPGIDLLLLIARGLVDSEVALVLLAGAVDVGVIDHGGLGKGWGAAKHGQDQ